MIDLAAEVLTEGLCERAGRLRCLAEGVIEERNFMASLLLLLELASLCVLARGHVQGEELKDVIQSGPFGLA